MVDHLSVCLGHLRHTNFKIFSSHGGPFKCVWAILDIQISKFYSTMVDHLNMFVALNTSRGVTNNLMSPMMFVGGVDTLNFCGVGLMERRANFEGVFGSTMVR